MTFDKKTQPRRLPFDRGTAAVKPYGAISSIPFGLHTEYQDDTIAVPDGAPPKPQDVDGLDLEWTEPTAGVFQATEPNSGKIRIIDEVRGIDSWYLADGVTPTDPPGTPVSAPGAPSKIEKRFAYSLKIDNYWPESSMGAGDGSDPPLGVPYTSLQKPATGNPSGFTKSKYGGAALSHAETTPMLMSRPRTHPITGVVEPGGERLLTDYTTTSPDPDGQAQSHGSEQPPTSGFDPKTPTITPVLTPSASGGTMLSGDVRYRLTNRKTISGVIAESDKGPIVSGSVTGPHGSVSVHADAETDTSIEGRLLYREDPSSPDRWHLVHEEAGHDAFTFVDTKSFTVLRHDNYGLTRHGLYPKYDGARAVVSSGGGSVPSLSVWRADSTFTGVTLAGSGDHLVSGYADNVLIDTSSGAWFDGINDDRLYFPSAGVYSITLEAAAQWLSGADSPPDPKLVLYAVFNDNTLGSALTQYSLDSDTFCAIDAVNVTRGTILYEAAGGDYMTIILQNSSALATLHSVVMLRTLILKLP